MWQTAQSMAEASGFQCAVVGGPVTGVGMEERDSVVDFVSRRCKGSCPSPASSCDGEKVTIFPSELDDPAIAESKLLSLLAGGVSGA